ncbi:Nucleotide-diphospho-sugar transferase [Trema orientale]|uniref:Nucleotide-diphospho-sugar transferase n=1 Tax=Trema orientale TaxID=63057 RepID=A0A2P5CCA3_TREOI|nr:Nucleotide-diphospho-sugar transferase [Trema orientale]
MRVSNGWRRFLIVLPLICFLPYFYSVRELHQSTTIGDLPTKKTKKFDHLVLGPAAGQGFPNRLHCQGSKALNKTHLSTSSHVSRFGDKIAFVTVFTIYNSSLNVRTDEKASNMVTVGNVSYSKEERSMAILNAFINFIQVTMPQSNIVILTDPASDLSMSRNGVTVYPIQGEYSRDKLMLQRIRSYIAFLETRLQELSQRPGQTNHYIFTDSDIAVVDNLGNIFHDFPNFHLALTFRNNKDQPLNSGFIAVRGTVDGILRAKNFLQKVLEVYKSKYIKASRMLGDQLALAWVVKSHPSFDARRFSKAQAFLEDVGDASLLFLPCAIYNWTPPEGAGQFHGVPLDVKVVHFKGSRKRLMLESWNFFSSSSNISDMLCLVLRSGRTKYDF